jgi:hypothetical protein
MRKRLCIIDFFLFTPPMKKEHTECSETSVYKIQTRGNHPKESIQRLYIPSIILIHVPCIFFYYFVK